MSVRSSAWIMRRIEIRKQEGQVEIQEEEDNLGFRVCSKNVLKKYCQRKSSEIKISFAKVCKRVDFKGTSLSNRKYNKFLKEKLLLKAELPNVWLVWLFSHGYIHKDQCISLHVCFAEDRAHIGFVNLWERLKISFILELELESNPGFCMFTCLVLVSLKVQSVVFSLVFFSLVPN